VVAVSAENLKRVLERLGNPNGKKSSVASPHSYLTQHGLEALTGSDVARIAIPAASQLNAALLDAASGHVITFGTPPNEITLLTYGLLFRNNVFSLEAGVTVGTAFRLAGDQTMSYWTIGPGDPNNFANWHLIWDVDSTGNMGSIGTFNPAVLDVQTLLVGGKTMGGGQYWTVPGFVTLGPIILQWGSNVILTPTPPAQTTEYIGYVAGVNQTQVVVATPQTTDNSLVWFATYGYGEQGFFIDIFRNAILGGTPGPLAVRFGWFSIGTAA
jgi:hypothetical protein